MRLRKLGRELGERLEQVLLLVDGAFASRTDLALHLALGARGAFRRCARLAGRRRRDGVARERGERRRVGHHVYVVHREVFRTIELLCDDKYADIGRKWEHYLPGSSTFLTRSSRIRATCFCSCSRISVRSSVI